MRKLVPWFAAAVLLVLPHGGAFAPALPEPARPEESDGAAARTFYVSAWNYFWYPSYEEVHPGDYVWFESYQGYHTWQGCPLPCDVRFPTPGTYNYICGIHGSRMSGTVVVLAPPAIAIAAPAAGAALEGPVTVSGTASHATKYVTSVQVALDSGAWQSLPISAGTSVSWSWTLNTTEWPNGAHTLRVRAAISTGLAAEVSRAVEFVNGPRVHVAAPASGAKVGGTVAASGNATYAWSDVAAVDVRVDSGAWTPATRVGSGSAVDWSFALDTLPYKDGAHTFAVRATSASGHARTATVPLTFANAPVVVFAAPTGETPVSGALPLAGTAATAADPISQVQWSIDGGPLFPASKTGTATSVDWSATLDTAKVANGRHTLAAVAKTAGGRATTAYRTIEVANPATVDLRLKSIGGTHGLQVASVGWTMRNEGNTATGPFTTLVEYEHEGAWRLVARIEEGNLGGFAEAQRLVTWNAPPGLVGSFPVRVTLDATGNVGENDETNNAGNTRAGFGHALVPGTDLRP